MDYGVNIDFFGARVGIEKAAELVAKAGFTQLDYSPAYAKEDWEAEMKRAAKAFAANGLVVNQTHAPFNRYGKHGASHGLYVERCAEATEYLGAKFMVVHGDEFDFENLTYTDEAALDYNHRYFLPFVERSVKNGYRLAFENVFPDWDRPRFSTTGEQLCALIDSYGDNACCCWDFGHANVAFKRNAPEVAKMLGRRIACTHFHDNTGRDSHQLPLTGAIDWKPIKEVFDGIGYEGVMSVEYSHGSMPEHLMEAFIKLTYDTTKYIWEKL